MKKQSRTVPRRRQSVSPTPRHLPLVDILIDTQAELQELVVASGLKVLEAMLEEDRAAVCGPRYAHQPARQASRTGHTPSQVVLGGRKVAIRRPRARRAGEEVPWRWCMNRNWPATILTQRLLTYRYRTTLARQGPSSDLGCCMRAAPRPFALLACALEGQCR